jgi:hypothetical protein
MRLGNSRKLTETRSASSTSWGSLVRAQYRPWLRQAVSGKREAPFGASFRAWVRFGSDCPLACVAAARLSAVERSGGVLADVGSSRSNDYVVAPRFAAAGLGRLIPTPGTATRQHLRLDRRRARDGPGLRPPHRFRHRTNSWSRSRTRASRRSRSPSSSSAPGLSTSDDRLGRSPRPEGGDQG